uniref:NAD(P)-dependent oxidoreductase n=1 Tax=Aminobacter niigataensis TaxID=83265 RepID=UPI002852A88A|nr:NAD(P)-dependent oxidoreductase [Aminobacter niigataensis]WMD00101.1 DUF1932 domain-containing protein [Aminobacter niigataensis]
MKRIALIGFGEAGQSISAGLVSENAATVSVFDISFAGTKGSQMRDKAREIGATPVTDFPALIENADIVLSTVVANVALDVATEAAQFVKDGQIYVDLNSVSPSLKRQMGEKFGDGLFVEGVVMARVAANGHRTPVLLAGSAASTASQLLNAAGMRTEVAGDTIGQASANKMVRSIFMKGFSALLAELLISADRYNITDKILQSLSQTFPNLDWQEMSSYYLGRAAVHGVRMGAEMNEVAETLRVVDLEPVMADAIGRRIDWVGSQLKGHAWAEGYPKTYGEILEALRARQGLPDPGA